MAATIQLSGVSKSFGTTTAVRDLDLEVPRGSLYGLLGPNGAGKTTTLRMIMDIIGPDRGQVEVFGRRVDDEVRTRVGYLPEERGLYQKMEVLDHLAFLGVLKGLDRSEARSRGAEWLERTGLADRADERVNTLSKGMQQKVQFIATVLHGPELLILDEPFSGLDPLNVDLLKEIVLEHHRAGTTVLFSTHQIEDAERLCERVCMIAGARKVLDGPVDRVKASFGEEKVALSVRGNPDFLAASDLVGETVDHGHWLEIGLADGADPQDLLREAIEAGVEVRRFELVDPPLREIFLAVARDKGMGGVARAPEATDPGRLERTGPAETARTGEGSADPDPAPGGSPAQNEKGERE